MSSKIFLLFFFCSLTSLSISQTTGLLKAIELTKEIFEGAFSGLYLLGFPKNPSYSYLFAWTAQPLGNGTFEREIVPICFVNMAKYGKGLVNEECVKKIKLIQKFDKKMDSIKLAYRCFKNPENYADYELRTVPIEMPVKDRGYWVINFTPKDDRHCMAIFMEDVGTDALLEELKKEKPELYDKVHLVDFAEPLTKEVFEESIPLPEVFHTNRQLTYVFTRDRHDVKNTKLIPVKHCIVTMVEKGKGLVHPGCADTLRVYQNIDSKLRTATLPYRCYLHGDPFEYELKTTSIDRLDYEDGQYVIYYQLKDFDHCSPKWGQNEDLGKAEEVEDDDKDDRITKDEL